MSYLVPRLPVNAGTYLVRFETVVVLLALGF